MSGFVSQKNIKYMSSIVTFDRYKPVPLILAFPKWNPDPDN